MESLEDVEVEKINKINKADFLSDVPANLRFRVTENIYDGVANKVLIFKDRDPDLVSNMIPKMTPMKVKKNEYVYKKGQFSSAIYLLFNGRVVEMDNDINFREYSVGAYFGEVEIFKNVPRRYNMKTLEDCQLMVIDRNDLLNILKFYPELRIDLISCAIIKDMKTKQTLHKIKDLKSLIRVEEFWLGEDTEFSKSVSEKIQGLYYFNKKKYESYLKMKMMKNGWFNSTKVIPMSNFLEPTHNDEEKNPKKVRAIKAEMRRRESISIGLAPERSPLPESQPPLQVVSAGKVDLRKANSINLGVTHPIEEARSTSNNASRRRLSGANFEEINKRLISDLKEKVQEVKTNFCEVEEDTKRITAKVVEIDGLIQKLLKLNDRSPSLKKEDVKSTVEKKPRKQEEESRSSIQLSENEQEKLSTNKKENNEEVDSFFGSFEADKEEDHSEKTVNKSNKKHHPTKESGKHLDQFHEQKPPAESIKSKSSETQNKPPSKKILSAEFNLPDDFVPSEEEHPPSNPSKKLEMIKEADENLEKMSSAKFQKSTNAKLKKPENRSASKEIHQKHNNLIGESNSPKRGPKPSPSPLPKPKESGGSSNTAKTLEFPKSEMANLLKEIDSQAPKDKKNKGASEKVSKKKSNNEK